MDAVEEAPRALVVDDDTVSRVVLAHMLRRAGYEVTEAADIPPAVELLGAAGYEVVFSDFSMPGGTGMDVLAALPSAPRPHFVLVTGIVEHADPAPGTPGIDARMTKPISSRALAQCLDRLVGAQGDG